MTSTLHRWTIRAFLAVFAVLGSWAMAADEPPGTIPLKGHTETVYAVAYSPDGKYVVTASFDKTLKLYEAATGKELKTFAGTTGHTNLILSLAFHPQGHGIASGSSDNSVKLWDIPSENALRDFVHADAVNAIALSADGKLLAGAGKDGTVKLWNPADGKPISELKGHVGPVTGVAFNADGKLVASTGSDGTVRFWDSAKGQPISVVGAHTGAANNVQFHTTSTYACSVGDDGMLKFWQLPQPVAKDVPAHADQVTALALSPDGAQVYSASADKTVKVTAFANPAQTRALVGATGAVNAVAPGGTLVAGGTADNRLILWNAADGKVLSNGVAHGGPVTGVSFHPQATQLVTSGADGLVKLWALPPVPGRALAHPDGVTSIALSPDQKRLITGGTDKVVRSWNLTTNAIERQFPGHAGAVTAVALSPNGQLLVSGGDDATIRFWNQTNGQQSDMFGGHAAPVTTLAFHPANTQLLSASEDGTVKLWALPPAAPKLFAHPDLLTSAAISPDGAKLLTGCNDKQARLWNLTSGQLERAFPGNTLAVTAVAFSANGAAVVGGGADKSVTVWNAADGKELKKFANLPAAVNAVGFSADGNTVAAGLADNSIRLLDMAQGKEIKSLAGHAGPVTHVAYTAKGDQVISSSADKTLQVWNVADGMSKAKLDHGAAVSSFALSKDGTKAATAGADKAVKVWTLADSKAVATIPTPADVRSVGFSPDGTRLIVAGADNKARVYGMDGKLLEFFTHDGPVVAAAYHGDGKRVATASADKTARLWTSALLWQATHTGPVRQAAFSAKGDRIVSGGDDKLVKVWNTVDGKEVKSIAAHAAPVSGVGLSADGARIVSAGADKTVKVWSADPPKAGVPEAPIAIVTLAAPPTSVTISPNGQRIAAGFTNQAAHLISVFDVATGKEVMSVPDHTGAVRALTFAPDNRTLVSAGMDKAARLSDINALAVLDAHPGGVAGVQFHSNPAAPQVLTGGVDKTVKLWTLADGKVVRTFGPLADPVTAVTFNRDFTQVGAAAGKVVKVWNAADGKELLTLTHPAPVLSLSFSADKARIATGAADNLTRVWDAATGKEMQYFRQAGPVRAVVYHNANTSVVAGSADKSVVIQPVSALRMSVAGTGPVRGLSMTPTGTHFLTAADDKTVKAFNAANGLPERTFDGAEGAVNGVAVSKNGLLVAAGGADKTVRVYTFADGKLVASIKAPAGVRSLAFTPNNTTLAAALDNNAVASWAVPFVAGQPLSADFGKPLQTFAHAGPATEVVFAVDSGTLYSGSQDKTIKVWKFAADGATKSLAHPNLVDAVAYDTTGNNLATGCHDGILRIWDMTKAPQPVVAKAINAHVIQGQQPAPIYAVVWTPDGKSVLSTSLDHSMKLFDAASGNPVREFKAYKDKEFDKGHQDGIYSAAFSPDGKVLVSASGDRTIKMWDVSNGMVVRDLVNPTLKVNMVPDGQPKLQPPHAHPGPVYGVRYTKDGKYIISVGHAPNSRGYLAVWNAADGKMLYGAELPLGHFNNLAISPDGKSLVVAPAAGRQSPETNAYILKMPDVVK
ncbi:MAG: hypothetical protein K2R98_27015 [Gemmataceae bacterium]|nr:hypothetical protein [Gemmataceae bacterium]